MKKVLAWLLLSWASFSSSAGVTLSNFPPNPNVLPGGGWQFSNNSTFANPTGPRAWVNGVYGGVPKFVATDSLALAGRVGAVPIGLATSIGAGDAFLAVARCLAGGTPICAAGTAAWLAYKYLRDLPPGDVPGSLAGNGLLDHDPGMAPTTATSGAWVANGDTRSSSGSAQDACTAEASLLYPTIQGVYATYNSGNSFCYYFRPNGDYLNGNQVAMSGTITQTSCPMSVDASNPAYNVPAGSPVGSDGLCPTARYNHVPITPEQAAQQVLGAMPSFPSVQWGQAVKDAIDMGGQTVPGTSTASGPATQTGQPVTSTTTAPDGTTTTTTTTSNVTYNYAGDTITYNEGATTTVNNAGAVTTTVTNGGAAPAPQDPKDPCTASPTRAGCVDIGTSPAAEVMPSQSVPITYTPTIFASPGGCPSPVNLSFTVSGTAKAYTISYQPLCDLMATLAPIFLALGAASASIIFMQGLKT